MSEKHLKLTREQKIIRKLSNKIVKAQRPIRILEAIQWDDHVKHAFFRARCKKLPKIGPSYYKKKRKLKYKIPEKVNEFESIVDELRSKLGDYSGVGKIMQRMCQEYITTLKMLAARGTEDFAKYSRTLYGSTHDAFYVGAPTLRDLASMIANTLENIHTTARTEADRKIHSAKQAADIMQKRLREYFTDHPDIRVTASQDIIADAAAGAEQIRMNSKVKFSDRNLRQLEVHEGWVHLGTTLNGKAQPICTFLSKGAPSSTVTQEGLAILIEILTMSSYPARVQRINNRIIAVDMAENGADFIEVFNFFKEHHDSPDEAFNSAARIFRGSTATGKPFTKDLSYSKGFISIFNYIRLAISNGLLSQIPLLFVGKTVLEDLHIIHDLVDEGIVVPPKYVPPQFKDTAALSAWAAYSLFINHLDPNKIADDFRALLRE